MPSDSNSNHDETPSDLQQHVRLDHFLKLLQFAESGGHAKVLIQGGLVHVNGELCTARKRKLFHGDEIKIDDEVVTVNIDWWLKTGSILEQIPPVL